MRMWKESYASAAPAGVGAAVSIVTHAALIVAAVVATARPPAGEAETSWIANKVYYIPPPNRIASQTGSHETLRYIELAPEGIGAGLGAPTIDPARKWRLSDTDDIGDQGRDTTQTIDAPPVIGDDTAFTILQVDSAAERDPTSAAPAYPATMLAKGAQGSVSTQYVVDTTGFADSASLRILAATHPDFADAVRAALPRMHFTPARIGERKVRQLVEQEFTFRITKPDTAKTTAAIP
jgi:TonB family protein